ERLIRSKPNSRAPSHLNMPLLPRKAAIHEFLRHPLLLRPSHPDRRDYEQTENLNSPQSTDHESVMIQDARTAPQESFCLRLYLSHEGLLLKVRARSLLFA